MLKYLKFFIALISSKCVQIEILAMTLLEALRHGIENLDWREDGLPITLSGGL